MKALQFAAASALAISATFAAACASEDYNVAGDPTAVEADQTVTGEVGAVTGDVDATTTADLTGQAVYDSAGVQVGTVDEVTTDASGAEIAVISTGTYLGMGAKRISAPTADLTGNADGTGLTLSMTADEIEAAPEYVGATPTYTPPADEAAPEVPEE